MTTHARDMTPEQQAAALAAIIKSGGRATEPPPPADPDQPKKARDMSVAERAAFLKNHKRKFNL
jgi:hypothetical protein